MYRTIIEIDQDKCDGCGICANVCHEAAIDIVDGKATLLRDDYCDGAGDCLLSCPRGAIRSVKREAAAYDEAAVLANKAAAADGAAGIAAGQLADDGCDAAGLGNWPIQIKLAPIQAPSFDGADLLVAADCTAYAYGNFHDKFIKGRTTLIACPKLDNADYSDKLAEILSTNDIKSITVTRMVVPCCGGLEYFLRNAIERCGKSIPLQIVTFSPDGTVQP